jgi:hypothetical protein
MWFKTGGEAIVNSNMMDITFISSNYPPAVGDGGNLALWSAGRVKASGEYEP